MMPTDKRFTGEPAHRGLGDRRDRAQPAAGQRAGPARSSTVCTSRWTAADAVARQGHCGVLGAGPASSRPAPTSSTCRRWTQHRSRSMGTRCAAPSSAWPPTQRCRWPPSTGSPWAAVWSWRWRARCASARFGGAARSARGQARPDPRRWGDAAPAPPRRPRTSTGHHADRARGRMPTRRSGSGWSTACAEPDTTARATAWQLARELWPGLDRPRSCAVVRTVDAAYDRPLAEGLRYEAEQVQQVFERGEAVEGIRAFIDKRTPEFV